MKRDRMIVLEREKRLQKEERERCIDAIRNCPGLTNDEKRIAIAAINKMK
jgi:hypothetical protein